MDRFVWFVLLVVISHLVTEFTRVTGYNRGPRQDVVTVNDSLIQPIKVQNLVLYPGQEYGQHEQQNQQYYSDNSRHSNYGNNNNFKNPNNKSNFLSSLFNQLSNSNNNNNQYGQEQSEMSNSANSNNLLNLPPSDQEGAKTFSFRPLIDSIFEIPISTLRAVNDLVGRLTGGFLQPAQQKQQQQQQQDQQQQLQQPTKYSFYPSYQTTNSYYGMQRNADTIQPKTQFEIVNSKRPTSETITKKETSSSPSPSKAFHNVGLQS